MRIKLLAIAGPLLVLFGAVACGSSSQAAPTLQSVAAQVGAVNVQHDPQTELFVKDEATATLNGRPVTIYVFGTKQAKDNWMQAASQFGPNIARTGDLYVITYSD